MIKKSAIHLLLILVAIFSSRSSKAQSVHLGIQIVSPDYPQLPNDSAYEGIGYDSISIIVHNADTNNLFTGAIAVVCHTTDTGGINFLPTDTLISFGGTIYTIPANDTIRIDRPVPYNFDPSHYKTGSNIVVVWPVANGVTLIDSFYTDVYFVPFSNAKHPPRSDNLSGFYPNPGKDYIRLSNQINAETVRIYDYNGKIIYKKNAPLPLQFSIKELGEGTYIIETTLKNKSRQYKRFVKM